jgi:NAD(P)-dependent dehydrogenase (short-subunit alcohol dehydrogenase family)
MDLELAGSVVAITGGTDGLGLALADRLLDEGAGVAVCGRAPERLDAARERWQGRDALVQAADVTRAEDLDAFVRAIVERWGRLDGVVNNAGKASTGPIESVDDDEWRSDLELKVIAAVHLTRLAVPHLRASGRGAVINVLSAAAKSPTAASLPTTASRAAGMAITKAWAQELGPAGIRVNSIMIGLIESGQWRRRAEAVGRPEQEIYESVGASIPLGRVGRPEEFADLAAFLLSPRASFLNGANIPLDGGANSAL